MKKIVFPVLVFLAHYLQCESLPSIDECRECRILTPDIKAGKVEEARFHAKVPSEQFLGLESYSGFITVNEKYDSNLFFWFFPAVNQAPLGSTPWIIWLQGGPGYSSLFGQFKLVGPLNFEHGQVKYRNTTLAQNYPVLFIDNPVGAGYSFTRHELGYPDNEDDVGAEMLEFLKQFLKMFPELRSAPLFLAGESYAGKYIPALGIQIHRHNILATWKQIHLPADLRRASHSLYTSILDPENQSINLRGLIIGGGMINPVLMMRYSRLVYALGLVDDLHINSLMELEQAAVKYWQEGRLVDAANKFNETIEFIKNISLVSVYNYLQDPTPNTQAPEFEAFIQRPGIRALIGAGDASFDLNNQKVYEKMLPDIMNTTQPFIEELLDHIPVLCYHGQQDIIMAYELAMNTYKSLRWRSWADYQRADRTYLKDARGNTLAYIKSGGGFTDMLIRRAGHMVPGDVPELATYIHYDFIEKNKTPQ